jgi:purine-binding chemotaxis protein CheW
MSQDKKSGIAQYLTFRIDGQEYGLPIHLVREINRISEITKVPEVPTYVAGVMNLRGKVIPVVNLRLRMSFEAAAYTKETCIIVVDASVGQVGLIVDSVNSVLNLDNAQVDHSPVATDKSSYIEGIGKLENGMLMILDIHRCLENKDWPEKFSEQTAA